MEVARDRANRDIAISMPALIKKICEKFREPHMRPKFIPAVESLMEKPSGGECDKPRFQSLLMSLLYVARFSRPDLLFTVSFLATRMATPMKSDMRAAERALMYLSATKDYALHLGGTDPPIFTVAVDASHSIHCDSGRGHGCMVIKCGGKVVYVRSFKLRHQTLSSTESELSAMCESSTYAEWLQLLAREMFLVDPDAAIVYEQDNTAAIFMNEMGKGTFQRSKHMLVRSMFVDDLIKNGRIKLTHVPTGEMVADIGTKVMSDARMKELCALIHLRT
jgi:hypothetical protein